MKTIILISISLLLIGCQNAQHPAADLAAEFNPAKDLIILNYDHAADRDDGHSAAADRTILQSLYGKKWICKHVIPVSGATGTNAKRFVHQSDKVMDTAFNDCAGWIAANDNRKEAIDQLTKRWTKTLKAGGHIWIKEGGQSDITAQVVKNIIQTLPKIDTTKTIHVVQHSDWNENHTTKEALAYVKANTDYIRIPDANPNLRSFENNETFAQAAVNHPTYGQIWQAAFEYLSTDKKLDFSDTGELMHILNLGTMTLSDFQTRFLK